MGKTFDREKYLFEMQEKKRKRRRELAAGRKKYELAPGFSWNGRCLTIEPTGHIKSKSKAEKILQDHLLTRTNLTLVTGQPNNGKLEHIKNMLDQRKFGSVRQHIKEIENKEKRDAYYSWLRQFGMNPNDVEDRIYDLYVIKYFNKVLDNDRNKLNMIDLIDDENSSFGYKCKLMVFDPEKGKNRTEALNDFIQEVENAMAPETLVESYEKEVYDEEKDETNVETVVRKFPQIPSNILVVADLSTDERKEFLRRLNIFRYRNFIKCFNTCLVYDVKAKHKTDIDYSHPTAIEGWNQVTYLNKNGKVIHVDNYHEELLFTDDE